MTPQLPPEGISQSAWDEAVKVAGGWAVDEWPALVEAVARAIDAATEREREVCAQRAELFAGPLAKAVARVIRQRTSPSNDNFKSIPITGEIS